MATELLTLAELKRRLRNPDTDDADLRAIIAEASGMVIERVKYLRTDDGSPSWASQVDAWTPATVPSGIKAAVFKMALHLEKFRGGDMEVPPQEKGYLPTDVDALITPHRDPTIA